MRGAKRGSPVRLPEPEPRLASAVGCETKRVYATEEEALAHRLLIPASNRAGIRAYTCQDCGLIHLGHRSKRR